MRHLISLLFLICFVGVAKGQSTGIYYIPPTNVIYILPAGGHFPFAQQGWPADSIPMMTTQGFGIRIDNRVDSTDVNGPYLRLWERGSVLDSTNMKTHRILDVTPPTDSTVTIDLESYLGTVCQIDMTSASTTKNIVVTVSNPITAGVYTFHWQNTGSTNSLDLPATMLDQTGTAMDGGTTYDIDASDVFFTCYWDGTNYYCK